VPFIELKSDLLIRMMSKITLILFEFILISFIVQSKNAKVTQTCETVACLEETFNSKIEGLGKQFSGNFVAIHQLLTIEFCLTSIFYFIIN
jgi:hypothetical protein